MLSFSGPWAWAGWWRVAPHGGEPCGLLHQAIEAWWGYGGQGARLPLFSSSPGLSVASEITFAGPLGDVQGVAEELIVSPPRPLHVL